MYSLDINFLNDRPELKPDAAARTRSKVVSTDSPTPLYIGIAVGILLPAIVGAVWFVIQSQNNQLQQQSAQLDSQLQTLKTQLGEIDSIKAQTAQIKAETQSLASVFTRIKPWSAMTQDVRDRLPPGVQIASFEQIPAPTAAGGAAPSPSPSPGQAAATAPPPTVYLKISGVASSFDAVNDFLLVLQRSNFLKADNTTLLKAELTKERDLQPISIEGVQANTGTARPPKLPPVVQFEIQTSLNEVPATELVRELERKGAVGLVTRIESLQQKGILPPTK